MIEMIVSSGKATTYQDVLTYMTNPGSSLNGLNGVIDHQ
jgi:hypothetical protein